MSTYETDFYGWTQETVRLLRQGRISEVDMDALIEEIEDMGKNQLGQLENRLTVLMVHLLKWQYQPEHRSNSWKGTIVEQRRKISRLIKKNPSLKPKLDNTVIEMYLDCVPQVSAETGLAKIVFPTSFEQTGWTVEQVLDEEFYPSER
ncbi:hypothetical conserved protein [Candidatus Nitrosoglobus terrae]|uniref:Hypothetical conserved protein n=1 Tax=Candidatus Nitrosoglobus terrae TaxID=1630141 RepID=A0A1Q2SNL6_9GAMM|nr:DUF29 domain-containing protein [Candidatus Nitrosoglobus terrae]BAW80711.1 hypothetical conserved protein [Candidatus Nitrosoglobus terrae]